MDTTLHVGPVFLRGVTRSDYKWALTQLCHLQAEYDIPPPQVSRLIVILALQNALAAVLPYTPVLLCLMNIMKDVQAHAQRRPFPKKVDPDTTKLRDLAAHETFCQAFLRVD